MDPVELAVGATTDVGRVREINQDAQLAAPPVLVVADGMGGHHGGEVASRIAVEELERVEAGGSDSRAAAAAVQEALAAAQARIADYAAEQGSKDPVWYAGTTVVAAVLATDDAGPVWVVANLGDSRAYLLTEEGLRRVSVDHSVVQELLDAGRITPAQAAVHPERHVVTRALGGPGVPEPDFFRLPAAPDVRLLLCSDGISGMIDDAAIARVLAEVPDPQDAADRLVAEALEAGGLDNATAVVADVLP